jgi:hypothetical protein
MTEMGYRPPRLAIAAPRRTSANGPERCYVRLAVLGARLRPGGWPDLLARRVASAHDVSWCDATGPRATAYDVRRVQLRVAAAHRPHVVALDADLADLHARHWDPDQLRDHLTHCARVLTQRGAVLLTAGGGYHVPWRRSRVKRLDEVLAELADRFGTVHLDRASSAVELTDRFASALARRGLELAR